MPNKRRAKRRSPAPAPIRIRAKHVDEIDPTKVAFALWMLAERIVRDKQKKAKK